MKQNSIAHEHVTTTQSSVSSSFYKTASNANTKPRKQEPHRIYIQKRQPNTNYIINNSTAIRFTDTTLAKDVTNLIRSKVGLKKIININSGFINNDIKSSHTASNPSTTNTKKSVDKNRYFNGDKLILVGIITGLEKDAIYFDHEHLLEKQQKVAEDDEEDDDDDTVSSSSRVEPINIVRTLLPTDNPLQIRDEMIKYLRHHQLAFDNGSSKLHHHHNPSVNKQQQQQNIHQTMTMWFFQPGDDRLDDDSDNKNKTDEESYLDYVELNGYCSGMNDSSVSSDDGSAGDDDEVSLAMTAPTTAKGNASNTIQFWNEGEYGYSFLLSSSSVLPNNNNNNTKYPLSKELYYHDRCIQSIAKNNSHTSNISRHTSKSNCYKEGYLYKRSRIDPNIWKKVYCILTLDELWYISRVITTTNKNNKTKKKQKYRYISLSNALLVPNSNNSSNSSIPNKIEICTARGDVYYFRTPYNNNINNENTVHTLWIQAIENYIQICSENSYLHLAELIMSEEEWVKCNRYGSSV